MRDSVGGAILDRSMSILRRVIALASVIALAACGGAAQPAATDPPASTPTATPEATSTPNATGPGLGLGRFLVTFEVVAGSKAIVRVNEQLADRTLPNDAVLTTEKVSGTFSIRPDGTFDQGAKIVADLTALESDVDIRDDFIKRNTLQTQRFPEATFVPLRVEGMPLPLAESGDLTFKLIGQMTIRGVTKELTFDVTATRNGRDLTAKATATPAFQFGTFGMSQPRVFSVISIKDEIRLEVELVAKQRT